MPGFDALAPDQKAVLQLLLKQGKSYDDIAGLLRLDRTSVRERALDALDALGAEDEHAVGGLAPERQDELADHLLLQQTASERAATREFLESSAAGRAWARGVSNELRPIGGDALPEIPAEREEVEEAFGALDERTAARERQQKSSRLGGWLILGAIGAVLGLGLLLFINSRGDDEEPVTQTDAATAPAPAARSCALTEASGATGATGATLPQQQITLQGPGGRADKRQGYAILAEGGLAFQAEGLRASDLYKVWLWTSPEEAVPLGFATFDRRTRRLAGAIQQLPAEAEGCASLVVTREQSRRAETPGPIVLRGAIRRQ